jgi:prepilin-type N-terminal cleavage/methylation domain-containing protein
MSLSFKRTAAAGFTLIELLIVVIILAIISAIAIPQFSAATSDAQSSAADANLATVRSAIEMYRAQHAGNVNPAVKASSGGTGCTGTIGSGAANSEQALKDQLMYASNAAGQTCTIADATYRYGPYLRQGIPADPFGQKNDVVISTTGAKIVPTKDPASGWAYDVKSGEFVLNKKPETATPTTPAA